MWSRQTKQYSGMSLGFLNAAHMNYYSSSYEPPHPATVDKQSSQFYEGVNAKLHFPVLHGGGFTLAISSLVSFETCFFEFVIQMFLFSADKWLNHQDMIPPLKLTAKAPEKMPRLKGKSCSTFFGGDLFVFRGVIHEASICLKNFAPRRSSIQKTSKYRHRKG